MYWGAIGGGMIVFLAGLQAIPKDHYEVARLDGATAWQRLRFITLPALVPSIFFQTVLTTINAFQAFDYIYILTRIGNGNSTMPTLVFSHLPQRFPLLPHGRRSGAGGGADRADLHPHRRLFPPATPLGGHPVTRDRTQDIAAFAALTLGAVAMIFPFVWMISTSLKPVAEQFDMALIPATPTLENYPRLFGIMPFHLMIWNSAKIALISVAGQLLTCSMAAFIFAVVRFPGRNALFVLMLVTLMVPGQVTVIPQFIIFKWLGLYGTQAPLYAPAFLGGAFGTLPDAAAVFPDHPHRTGRGRTHRRRIAGAHLLHHLSAAVETGAGSIRHLRLPVFLERPVLGVDLSAVRRRAHPP